MKETRSHLTDGNAEETVKFLIHPHKQKVTTISCYNMTVLQQFQQTYLGLNLARKMQVPAPKEKKALFPCCFQFFVVVELASNVFSIQNHAGQCYSFVRLKQMNRSCHSNAFGGDCML